MPNITTVGIKASLSTWEQRTDVPATTNLALEDDRMLSTYSIENLSILLEQREFDLVTWTAIQDVAGIVVSNTIADTPVVHPGIPTESARIRWRNPTAGALWIYARGWTLV